MALIHGMRSTGEILPVRVNNLGEMQPAGTHTNSWVGQNYESGSNLALAAGANTLDLTAIPAGSLGILTGWTIQYSGTVATVRLSVAIRGGGNNYYVFHMVAGVVTGQRYIGSCFHVMGPGYFIRAEVANATAGDDLVVQQLGYLVTI
jgi:hypothetical protein